MTDAAYNIITPPAMQGVFHDILIKQGFNAADALQCATIFTANSVDGVYTHGVNRFPRFIEYTKKGLVIPGAKPTIKKQFGGIEQWDGNLAAGVLNAVAATDCAIELAQQNGIGCVALANTNHWMRGGYYGWHAAKKGFVLLAWTNTIGIMPAWNAVDGKLGNNPFVMAVPYNNEAIVLDMAMSQFSYGAMELAAMKNEKLPVSGGYDVYGSLTNDPASILESKRSLPIGYWKGAGLSFLLDVLATILSGGLSTSEISKQQSEHAVSQIFISIDLSKFGEHSLIASTIQNIISDYHQSIPITSSQKITYPGERVLATRMANLENGIPVLRQVWEQVLNL